MKPGTIALLLSFLLAVLVSAMQFYFSRNITQAGLFFAITFVTAYSIYSYVVDKFVYNKIKVIYKMVNNMKLGRDLKDALGEYVSDDPVKDVEEQVQQWAISKKDEIDTLKKNEQYRKEFLGNVSHEFKTPLFSIQGYVHTLLDGAMDDPQVNKRFLEKTANNIERLCVLVSDLDEITKLETGQVQLNSTDFDLSQLVGEIIEMLEEKANQSGIKLTQRNKSGVKTKVRADKEKIRQVLVNLIDNSIKYGKREGNTFISYYDMHENVLIEVTDDGIGIEEKHLPRIFERFYRTDASRSRQIGGSGLGLAIVKHIIEAHQQTINVRSSSNVGTTFAFTLRKA